MGRSLPLDSVRPTQLYISKAKLADVLAWFDVDESSYEPLPAFEYEGEWYLADGHTRAFAAFLGGADQLRITRDERLRTEYDFEVYRACIEWCEEEGVHTIEDLAGRVVEPATYERRWIERCRAIAEE